MAAKTKKVASNEGRKPVVVVDNAHVIYKVFGTGRKVTGNMAKGGLFTKKIRVREVHAVKGVSFTIYEGESVGIIGSNGSGKSSLMRAVAGLTPLAEGAVYAFARPSLLGVGAVLLPALSGERNIILGGLAMGFSKKEIQEKADDITKFAGIEEFIDNSWYDYAGGATTGGRHPWVGETNLKYTGPKPPYANLDVDKKYSWLKTPRWKGHAMEVGPLSRMLVGFAGNLTTSNRFLQGVMSA